MVATPHADATRAGIEVLSHGGNAVDAVIAAAAVLTVIYPHMCSIGGDAFALVYDPERSKVTGFNGSGRSPRALTAARVVGTGRSTMPLRGPLPVTVPGVVDVWHQLSKTYGRSNWADLLEPAVAYARDGFAMTARVAASVNEQIDLLYESDVARELLLPDGCAMPGQSVRLPQLARTLQQLAEDPRSLYVGNVARDLVADLSDAGGILSFDDLAAHRGEWVVPIQGQYGDTAVVELPPNSGAAIALIILGVFERLGLSRLDLDDPSRIDGMVRATRLAFQVARPLITDPAYMSASIEELLSDETLERLADEVRRTRGHISKDGGDTRGDTVYLCATDHYGLSCSFIESVYFPFGSGIVGSRTGVLFQNRGAYFSLDPSHPNALAPGKRTYHTLMPAMALRENRPWLVFGTMGADGQPQTQAQVLTSIIDSGIDVQWAIDRPRWLLGRFLLGDPEETLAIEAGFPRQTIEGLRKLDHAVRVVPTRSEVMGHAQAIRITDEGFRGAADPRSDGLAAGPA